MPRTAHEVLVWAVCIPVRHWKHVVRYDGRTFEDNYARGISRFARALLPLRSFYLLFLLLWPWVAFFRAIKLGRLGFWRDALLRPDLTMTHPGADYDPDEIAWARPDYAFAMFYAHVFVRSKAPYFWLDEKHRFMAAASQAGFPLPPTFTVKEAKAIGGTFVVKEPENDLGYGVTIVDASELEPEDDAFVIQSRLLNHPRLLEVFPKDAPLSSFRVITLRAPDGSISVLRTAVRIGMSGSAVDNTAQGGIWSRVDLQTGALCRGVMKKTFGSKARYTVHPNTGKDFVGLVIPWFEEGQRMALDAHQALAPEAISLGWDIGLAEERPVLLEVNVWTACYDYDCQTDAFTPSAAAILAALRYA
jgi:hypothetical protein